MKDYNSLCLFFFLSSPMKGSMCSPEAFLGNVREEGRLARCLHIAFQPAQYKLNKTENWKRQLAKGLSAGIVPPCKGPRFQYKKHK